MQRLNDMSTSELITTARNYSASIKEIGVYSELVKQLTDRLAFSTAATSQALTERADLRREVTAYEATVTNLEAQLQGLAAESGQMLRLLTDISENHGEFVNEDDDYMYASVPLDYVSEINMYVSRDVNAENPFEHTDAALAEIRAQGVDMAIEHLTKKFEGTGGVGVPVMTLEHLASELRKEQGK